jgi:hypothetical protein
MQTEPVSRIPPSRYQQAVKADRRFQQNISRQSSNTGSTKMSECLLKPLPPRAAAVRKPAPAGGKACLLSLFNRSRLAIDSGEDLGCLHGFQARRYCRLSVGGGP